MLVVGWLLFGGFVEQSHPLLRANCKRAPGIRALAAAASFDYQIAAAEGNEAINECAQFFVQGFWVAGTTSVPAKGLSSDELEFLVEQQAEDMIGRYGESVAHRRMRSDMLLARDAEGNIGGCAGVEMALIEPQTGTVLPRGSSEALLKKELSSMGPSERQGFRHMSAVELTRNLFPEYQCYALMANLAVDAPNRGSGLGKQLCAACERAAEAWGVAAIMLQVEECNFPARALYGSVGYQDVHIDDNAIVLRVEPGASSLLTQTKSSIVLMGKRLEVQS